MSSCGEGREGLSLWSKWGRRAIWRQLKRQYTWGWKPGHGRVNWWLVFYDSTEWIARLRCHAIKQHTVDAYECGYCASCHTPRPESVGPALNWW